MHSVSKYALSKDKKTVKAEAKQREKSCCAVAKKEKAALVKIKSRKFRDFYALR